MAEEKECLVLGPGGAGKTVLLKRLKALSDEEETSSTIRHKSKRGEAAHPKTRRVEWSIKTLPITQPTTGTNLVTLTPLNCILKEYGYSMASLWKKAMQHTNACIYVVDASNPQQISAATVLLMELLADEGSRDKPFLLLYNKTDLPSPMSQYEMAEIMRVRDLRKMLDEQLAVLNVACATGEGLAEVMKWVRTTVCSPGDNAQQCNS